MILQEKAEYVNRPEAHYVYVEKEGPMPQVASEAWGEALHLVPVLGEQTQIESYTGYYGCCPNRYRAGFAVADEPQRLVPGLQYERMPGGGYARFLVTGPYSEVHGVTRQVWNLLSEQGIEVRDGFTIENYLSDPAEVSEDRLQTEILIPVTRAF